MNDTLNMVNKKIDVLNLKLDVILEEIVLLGGVQKQFHEDIRSRINTQTTREQISDSCKIINFNPK